MLKWGWYRIKIDRWVTPVCIRLKMRLWCEEQFGKDSSRWVYIPDVDTFISASFTFKFKNEDDFVLFRLTWIDQ